MKLHVLFALICSVSFSVAAGNPSAPVPAPIFGHVVGCPFEWLQSDPTNPEHLYLTLVVTRTLWVEFMCGPQVTFSPVLAPVQSDEEIQEPLAEAESADVYPAVLFDLSGGGDGVHHMHLTIQPDDLPFFLQYVQNSNALNLLINFWEHFPLLIPLQAVTRAAMLQHQNILEISAEDARIWFDTVVSSILLELLGHIHPARRVVLDNGIEELIEKMDL